MGSGPFQWISGSDPNGASMMAEEVSDQPGMGMGPFPTPEDLSTGDGHEEPLAQSILALQVFDQHRRDGDTNPNFLLRPDALTAVFWVTLESASDDDYEAFFEPNASMWGGPVGPGNPEPLESAIVQWFQARGTLPFGLIPVSPDPMCPSIPDLLSCVIEATGGAFAQIDAPGSTTDDEIPIEVERVAGLVTGAASPFQLPDVPISSSLRVNFDGSVTPRSTVDGFDYNEASNSIVLHGSFAPHVGRQRQDRLLLLDHPVSSARARIATRVSALVTMVAISACGHVVSGGDADATVADADAGEGIGDVLPADAAAPVADGSDAVAPPDTTPDVIMLPPTCGAGLIDLTAYGHVSGNTTTYVGSNVGAAPVPEVPGDARCTALVGYEVALLYIMNNPRHLRVSTDNAGTTPTFETVVWAIDHCRPINTMSFGCDGELSATDLHSTFTTASTLGTGMSVYIVVAGLVPSRVGTPTEYLRADHRGDSGSRPRRRVRSERSDECVRDGKLLLGRRDGHGDMRPRWTGRRALSCDRPRVRLRSCVQRQRLRPGVHAVYQRCP